MIHENHVLKTQYCILKHVSLHMFIAHTTAEMETLPGTAPGNAVVCVYTAVPGILVHSLGAVRGGTAYTQQFHVTPSYGSQVGVSYIVVFFAMGGANPNSNPYEMYR